MLKSPIAYCLYVRGREVPYGLNLIGRFERKGSGKPEMFCDVYLFVFVLGLQLRDKAAMLGVNTI